ncbi:MAG TPA: hypothetical protein VME24_07960, partial [Alphaproteobacteria bacterium]|nr:hypothetical protein [Alphaproteobacteria bacterium]
KMCVSEVRSGDGSSPRPGALTFSSYAPYMVTESANVQQRHLTPFDTRAGIQYLRVAAPPAVTDGLG